MSPISGLLAHSSVSFGQLLIPSRAGFTNLHDLMPDNLRWSQCNNNRKEGHNKCNVLESYPLPQSVEQLSSTKQVPGGKKVGDCCSRVFSISVIVFSFIRLIVLCIS